MRKEQVFLMNIFIAKKSYKTKLGNFFSDVLQNKWCIAVCVLFHLVPQYIGVPVIPSTFT